MTSHLNGHPPYRSSLIHQAGKKRRTSDDLPPYLDNYVPFAPSQSSQSYSSKSRQISTPPWQELGLQLGRHLLQLGTNLLKSSMSWRPRDLLGIPIILIVLWGIVLWWGEEAIFRRKVEDCTWDRWESWVRASTAFAGKRMNANGLHHIDR